MVRPKGSQHNISVAVAFSDIIIVRTASGDDSERSSKPVPCKGRRSLYAAFAACVPNLARDSRDKRPHNRQGVAAIELSKAMQLSGMKSVRILKRVDERSGIRLSMKVWEQCRWADPAKEEDCKVLVEKLAEVQSKHEELKECTADHVKEVLQSILGASDESELEDEKSAEEMEDGSQEESTSSTVKTEGNETFPTLLQTLPSLHAQMEQSVHRIHPALIESSVGPGLLATNAPSVQASLQQLFGLWPTNGLAASNATNPLHLMAQLTALRMGHPSAHEDFRATQNDSALLSSYSSNHHSQEVEALRAQVMALERTIDLVTMQERDALRFLPVLLAERSVLLAENAKLVAECTALRADRTVLLAEMQELRRRRC